MTLSPASQMLFFITLSLFNVKAVYTNQLKGRFIQHTNPLHGQQLPFNYCNHEIISGKDVLQCSIQALTFYSCLALLYPTHFLAIFPFFYQIGDADEAEKISPDEDAEKPDGNKTSDNGDTEKLYQKQEASTQVNVYK